ncbi:MAG: methionine adenosyltransferase [Pirellulaceae bacterium]
MENLVIESRAALPVSRRETEYVERKGLGHPDSICDAVMESISVALCRAYVERTGGVLHHNIDKGLLVAGQTSPKFGGGTIDAPMRLIVGDRATSVFDGRKIPVEDIVQSTVEQWFRQHLRFVDPKRHLVVQNELRPGSGELTGIFQRRACGGEVDGAAALLLANDTSTAVGFAPLTETEHLVLAAEHLLNSKQFKQAFPETGEDVKVMAARRARRLELTVAMAFLDRPLFDEDAYFHRKRAVVQELQQFLTTKLHELDEVDVQLNMLDQPGRGESGAYLTVLGTSAECGDGGQVGRGNRASGLISCCRPMTMEAVAGKNPVSHVGKVYNLLARQMAERIWDSVEGVQQVYVWLCSQIGRPIDQPWLTTVEVALADDAVIDDMRQPIDDILHDELANVETLIRQLIRGELRVI